MESHLWNKAAISQFLLAFLREHNAPVSEHDLIRHLDSHQCFAAFANEPANLRLFRKHFITRHCLYGLQGEVGTDWQLDLGPIHINLQKKPPATDSASGHPSLLDAALRGYYLDLRNLDRANVESVETLLKDFWRKFAAADKSLGALAVLDLKEGAEWADVQKAYRRKVQRLHPDRGGTAAEFAVVQEAYEILQQRFGQQR
ncbi:MAG: DnaJ domain-containing protein [Cellvibrionaceae bacterium]|nr:DnaJ domain-containing protein [Cellvibrionaceae bacterium]